MIAKIGELEEIHDSGDAIAAVKRWLTSNYGEGYEVEKPRVTKQPDGWYMEYRNPPRRTEPEVVE